MLKLGKIKMKLKNKKASEKEELVGVIFFVIILILAFIAIMLFTNYGKNAIEYIKDLFRFK